MRDANDSNGMKLVDRTLVTKGRYGVNPKIVKEALAKLEKNPDKFVFVPLTMFPTKNRGTIRSAFFRQRPDIRTFFEDGYIAVGLKD